MTTTITELDNALNGTIHALSERSANELADLVKMLERAYVHVLIEQHLRVNGEARVTGVSLIAPKANDL